MAALFKMNPKTPFMKALVGKQGNLPQHLQDAIKDAPAKKTTDPKKKKDDFRYESDAPEVIGTAYTKDRTERVTEYKKGGKTMKKGDTYERGGFQTPKKVVDTGRDASGRKEAGRAGNVDVEVKKGDIRFSTGKKTKKKIGTGKSPAKKTGTTLSPKKNAEVASYREGKGRIKVTTSRNSRGAGKLASGTGETDQTLSGYGETNTKVAGSAGKRIAKGAKSGPSKVVKEKTASKIKERGVKKANIKASAGKSPKATMKATLTRKIYKKQ